VRKLDTPLDARPLVMLNISSARTSLFYSIHTFLSSNSLPLTCRTSKRSLFPVNVHTLLIPKQNFPCRTLDGYADTKPFSFRRVFPSPLSRSHSYSATRRLIFQRRNSTCSFDGWTGCLGRSFGAVFISRDLSSRISFASLSPSLAYLYHQQLLVSIRSTHPTLRSANQQSYLSIRIVLSAWLRRSPRHRSERTYKVFSYNPILDCEQAIKFATSQFRPQRYRLSLTPSSLSYIRICCSTTTSRFPPAQLKSNQVYFYFFSDSLSNPDINGVRLLIRWQRRWRN
jgi:hypothetical protein